MYTLYSMQRSGNSYKVRLALAQLGLPYRLEEVDILRGESHTPEFLAKNPSGQVPLLEVAPGRFIAEVRRDMDEARLTLGLVIDTAGSINDGSRLSSMRTVMWTIQSYGRPQRADNGAARRDP